MYKYHNVVLCVDDMHVNTTPLILNISQSLKFITD